MIDATPTGLHREAMSKVWSPSVDKYFGETIRMHPMRRNNVNESQRPDPTRPVIFTVGKFVAPAAPVTIGGDGSLGRLQVVQTKPCFSIALENLPYQLRRGDIIERMKDGTFWECEPPEKDALGVRCKVPVLQCGLDRGAVAP